MMSNLISISTGAALLFFSILTGSHYQEEIFDRKSGAKIWFLTACMGIAMTFSGGGSAFFLVLQTVLGFVMAACCLLQLHREKLMKTRRALRHAKASIRKEEIEKEILAEATRLSEYTQRTRRFEMTQEILKRRKAMRSSEKADRKAAVYSFDPSIKVA